MPVVSTGVVVGTSAVQIAGPSVKPKYVYVQNGTDGTLVHVGGSNVTASNGILASTTNTTVFQLNADDALFAISDTVATVVKVVEVS